MVGEAVSDLGVMYLQRVFSTFFDMVKGVFTPLRKIL